VTLFDPAGKKLVEVDNPVGAYQPERVSITTDASGGYMLELRPAQKDAGVGRYEVKIAELRMPTPQDQARVLAERAFSEGMTLERQGTGDSIKKALEKREEALRLFKAAGDRQWEGFTLHRLGITYYLLGENQKALDYYNQALPLSRAVSSRRGEVAALTNLGNVYQDIGDYQIAMDHFNQSLALNRASGDRRGEANTLNNLGNVYYLIKEKQKAMDHYNQSLALSRAGGDRRGEAWSLNSIGIFHQSLGDNQKALDYFNQSLPLRRAVGDRRGEAMSLTNIGEVYQSLSDNQKAMDYFKQALQLSQAVGHPTLEVKTLLGKAKVEAAQDKLFDARSTIESALNIIESIRTSVVSPELRSSYFEPAKKYYEFNIDLLMRLHKLRPGEGYDRAALQTAERARARSLLERLAEAHLKIRSGADPALVERERSLRRLLIAKTERQMRILNRKHTAEQAAEIANEIKALTAQYQDAESDIRAKSPRYAALTQPQPLNSQEIQRQTLDDRTLLLEYFLGDERSYLWVVSASWVKSYELPKRADIEETALLVKKLLTARATREEGESPKRRQARITGAEARYWPEAARLSRMILGPAISELSGKRLAIVPDGELQDVAFGALPTPQSSGAGANALNFGGGFNYWLTNQVGVRFEFRDHVTSAGGTTTNLIGLRGGVAFAF
jgi:tetratricopeptide (TPR) repeat protein